jgi:hypothetical protein
MKSKFKNLLSFLLLFVLLATTLCACKSAGVVPPTIIETTQTTTKEVIRDTVFQVEKDSSYYKAYVECVNGKAVLKTDKKTTSTPGKNLEPPKVSLEDNVLVVDCVYAANKLFAEWKDVYIREHRQIIKEIHYPVPQELSWWQKTQIILGRIFLTLLAILIILIVIKKFTVIKY